MNAGADDDPTEDIRRRLGYVVPTSRGPYEYAAATQLPRASRHSLTSTECIPGSDKFSLRSAPDGRSYQAARRSRDLTREQYEAALAQETQTFGSLFPNTTGLGSPTEISGRSVEINWHTLPDHRHHPLKTADLVTGTTADSAVVRDRAHPESSTKMRRLIQRINWSKIRDLSAVTVLIGVAGWLILYSDSDSVLVTNHLTVLILLVTIAALIVSIQKKDL